MIQSNNKPKIGLSIIALIYLGKMLIPLKIHDPLFFQIIII